jgi:hypothetical protein
MVQSRGVAPLRGKFANDMPTNIQKEVESHTSMGVQTNDAKCHKSKSKIHRDIDGWSRISMCLLGYTTLFGYFYGNYMLICSTYMHHSIFQNSKSLITMDIKRESAKPVL